MNRWISALTALGIGLAGCTGGTDPARTGSDPAGSTDCPAALDQALRAWERAGFSGSVAISTAGTFDCRAGYGSADRATHTPNTAETVFSIGSISKAFAAAAVLALVDAGELALDDRAGDLVPGLRGPAARATVRQLLLHTSGLTGSAGADHEPLSRRRAVEAIGDLGGAFEPGTDYAYSNAGYTLLALIVDATSGTGYRDYVGSRILTLPDGDRIGGFWDGSPAAPGPRATGYLDDGTTGATGDFAGPHWALAGNGDLAMTMPELATWTDTLFTGDLLASGSVELLSRPGFDHGDGTSETPGWVAIDASRYGEPILTAAGGGGDVGHDAVVAWLPSSQRTIAVASNTPDVTAGELLRAVAPALIADEPLPTPKAPEGEVDPSVAGRYETASGAAFRVSAHDDELAIAAHGADAVTALFPAASDDVSAHEAAVLDLLTGETDEGRTERQALESGLAGPIGDIEPAGTIVENGELRTYVTAVSGSTSILAWYSLDSAGNLAAATIDAAAPTLRLVRTVDGYRPAGTGPDVVVTFDARRITVTGPNGATVARRST